MALTPVPGARLYRVQADRSEVRILVYRAGTLSTLGHNHVIAAHALDGRVYLHPQLDRSAFEVIMPVAELSVDDPQLRAQQGAAFATSVPDGARQGTRHNMLSGVLLDSDHYPQVRMVSVTVKSVASLVNGQSRSQSSAASLPHTRVHAMAVVKVDIKDHWRTLQIPLDLEVGDNELTVSGEFSVKQTDLGLTPFSVMLGALQVQDEIRVKFQIRAGATL